VSWHREFTPNPAHRELYQEMMIKWQSVYAEQLGLVDSGLTTSMWQAPGLTRRPPVAPHPKPLPYRRKPSGNWPRRHSALLPLPVGEEETFRRSLNPITITALPFSLFARGG
jgi:hypothetical protein